MSDGDRLVSWKRIASYLDRGERTVRRWAAEDAMPVHRVSDARNSSVFAFKSELDQWLDDRSGKRAGGATRRKILAVLPLDNLSTDPALEQVVDGLTEEVISSLGQIKALGVIARTSIMAYKGTNLSVAEIGQELGADYVIEGSMRAERGTARITMQLIAVSDQTHLWAENYEHSLVSPMALQREVAQRVALEIGEMLTGASPQNLVLAPAIEGPGADEYFLGRFLLDRMTPDSLRKSVVAFDRAVALEPKFGPAYSSKAEALQLLTNFTEVPPAQVMPEAMEALSRAVSYSPNSAEVFASLGYVNYTYLHEWGPSEQAFRRSLALNPSLSVAHQWYGELLSVLGRFEEALYHADEAHRLDPRSLAVDTSRGHILWLARRYGELIAAMDIVLAKEADCPLAHILKFMVYYEQGDYAAALHASEAAMTATGEPIPFVVFGKMAQGAAEDPQHFEDCIGMLKAQSEQGYVPQFFFAMLYCGLGDANSTIDCLELACDEGGWHVAMLGQAAMFDGLRKEQRFDELLKRLELFDSRFQISDRLDGFQLNP